MRSETPSSYEEGHPGFRDNLGFPVRHGNVAQEHLQRQMEVANQLMEHHGLTTETAVVLYNESLRPANNPFAQGNAAIQPDVQVFVHTREGWRRIGLPVEIEPASLAAQRFGNKDSNYRDNNGGGYQRVTYP
jgi:hypothetical protein